MNKYVKFTGKFTDLIPDGWTFQKLFARNYRQYHKTCDGKEHSQSCRIWQHLGGYLEIEDLFNNSYLIVEQIKNGKIDKWAHKGSGFGGVEKIFYSLVLDEQENRFINRYTDEYRKINPNSFYKKVSEEEYDKICDNYYSRYREFNLRPEMIIMIQDLLNKGWITVTEDDRKK